MDWIALLHARMAVRTGIWCAPSSTPIKKQINFLGERLDKNLKNHEQINNLTNTVNQETSIYLDAEANNEIQDSSSVEETY